MMTQTTTSPPRLHKPPPRLPYPKKLLQETIQILEKSSEIELPSHAIKIIIPNLVAFEKRLRTPHTTDSFHVLLELFLSNQFQRLSQALTANQLATINRDNIETLKRLFPDEPPSTYPDTHLRLAPVSPESLHQTLRLMSKRRRAPGLSGITPQHLLYLIETSTVVHNSLTSLVNQLLSGETSQIPNCEYLKYTKLAPLRKKDNGIRPIGVNETLLNLCSRLALQQCTQDILTYLHKLDFGFNKAGATEAVPHCINTVWRYLKQSKLRFIILKFDFSNAYNSVLRSKIFEIVAMACPHLLPYLKFRYQDVIFKFATTLENDSLHCTSGVCQGCPLSSALFQLVMSYLLKPIRDAVRFPIFSFQDDVKAIVPDLQAAQILFPLIKERALEFGLHLNTKSAIFSDIPISPTEIETFPFLSQIQIEESGLEVLGASIGSQTFIQNCLDDDLATSQRRADHFLAFIHQLVPQADSSNWKHKCFQFIKWSIASLPIHRLRTTSPDFTKSFAIQHDQIVASAVLKGVLSDKDLSFAPRPISDLLDAIPSIPNLEIDSRITCSFDRFFLKRGGIGIYSAVLSHEAAYVGSVALTYPGINDFMLQYFPQASETNILLNLQNLRESIEAKHNITINRTHDSEPILKLQHSIYNKIQHNLTFEVADIILNCQTETQFARFASRTQLIATAFIYLPLSGRPRLSDQEFEDNLLLTLGLPPFIIGNCALCNSSLGSSIEDHSVAKCARFTNKRVGSTLEKGVREGLIRLSENPSSNEIILENLPTWNPRQTGQPKHRADLLVSHCSTPIVIDVSTTTKYVNYRSKFYKQFPNYPKRLHIKTGTLLRNIGSHPTDNRTILDFFSGLAATERERMKHRFYNKRFSFPASMLTAAGIESHGGIGAEFSKYLEEARIYIKDSYSDIDTLQGEGCQRSAFRRCIDIISIYTCKANTILFDNIRHGYYKRTTPRETGHFDL